MTQLKCHIKIEKNKLNTGLISNKREYKTITCKTLKLTRLYVSSTHASTINKRTKIPCEPNLQG